MIKFVGNSLIPYEGIETGTIEECVEYCKKQKRIGLDIETTRKFPLKTFPNSAYEGGLDPYLSKVVMLQIGTLEQVFVIDVRCVDISPLSSVLESNSILKVGHNLKFEGTHLAASHGIFLQNVWDTMITEKVLYNGLKMRYSLAALAYRYLGIETVQNSLFEEEEEIEEEEMSDLDWLEFKEPVKKIDKSTRLEFLTIGDNPFTTAQILYGVDDILYPLRIQQLQQKGRVLEDGTLYYPKLGISLENQITQVLAKMQLRGLYVDIEGWLALYEKNLVVYRKMVDYLNAWVIKHHPKFTTLDLFNPDGMCNIEWSSSKQVIQLAKHMGFCPKEKSKQTNRLEYTVGAKALFKLLTNANKDVFFKHKDTTKTPEPIPWQGGDDVQAFILNYLLLKKYEQLTTTFGKEWLVKYIHPITKKVHTNFMQLMNTGRLSSTSPNAQQIPNGKDWRKLFIAGKGNKLIASDFASQEVRILAQVSEVSTLRNFFNLGHEVYGKDFHSFTASKTFSIIRKDPNLVIDPVIHKQERNISKSITFKISFGGSAFSLAEELGITVEEAESFISGYLDGFEGMRENFELTKKKALETGRITLDDYTGKLYFYPEFEEIEKNRKQAISYYPDNYRSFTKEEKEEFKKSLYENYPEVRNYWKNYGILKGSLERRSLNYRIQGKAAVQSKLAMLLMDKYNKDLDYGLVLFVHDESLFRYRETEVEKKNEYVKNCMVASGAYVCPDVKMGASSDIGDYWIH